WMSTTKKRETSLGSAGSLTRKAPRWSSDPFSRRGWGPSMRGLSTRWGVGGRSWSLTVSRGNTGCARSDRRMCNHGVVADLGRGRGGRGAVYLRGVRGRGYGPRGVRDHARRVGRRCATDPFRGRRWRNGAQTGQNRPGAGKNPGAGADVGLHSSPDPPPGPAQDGVTGPETGRTSHWDANFARIVDNATEIMYPISGWIPLLVCVPPSLQPRTPASPPPSGRGSAFSGQMSESFSPKQRDKWRYIVLH